MINETQIKEAILKAQKDCKLIEDEKAKRLEVLASIRNARKKSIETFKKKKKETQHIRANASRAKTRAKKDLIATKKLNVIFKNNIQLYIPFCIDLLIHELKKDDLLVKYKIDEETYKSITCTSYFQKLKANVKRDLENDNLDVDYTLELINKMFINNILSTIDVDTLKTSEKIKLISSLSNKINTKKDKEEEVVNSLSVVIDGNFSSNNFIEKK